MRSIWCSASSESLAASGRCFSGFIATRSNSRSAPRSGLVWRVPTSSRRVAQILTNPIYAGAYAYGRRRQETVIDNGRKRVRRGIAKQDPQDWTVLLRDHHDGYITWDQFERNQELLSENMTKVRGRGAQRPRASHGPVAVWPL